MATLDQLRKHASDNLRAQALQRAHATVAAHGLTHVPGHVDSGYNPAVYQRAVGNNAQAATDWEAHHPAAMKAGNIPPWVMQQMGKVQPGGGSFAGTPGQGSTTGILPPARSTNPLLNALGGGASGQFNGGHPPVGPIMAGGGTTGTPRPVDPGVSQMIHLGGGLFLHPLTGEIHGIGGAFPPSNGMGTPPSLSQQRPPTAPVAPTPVAM